MDRSLRELERKADVSEPELRRRLAARERALGRALPALETDAYYGFEFMRACGAVYLENPHPLPLSVIRSLSTLGVVGEEQVWSVWETLRKRAKK